jgi:hypothetical protein
MRSVRFVCLFVIVISMLVLAQSNRAPVVNQPNVMAQQRHPGLPLNLSQMPQGALLGQHRARAFKETAIGRGSSSSGLNFAPAVPYDSGGRRAYSVRAADVNRDGKPDLVVTNQCVGDCTSGGIVSVLLGNGDGTFQAALTYTTGGVGPLSVAVADVNGDGKPDLLVANEGGCGGGNGCVGVLLGNGDGTFQPVVTYGSGGSYATFVVVADINGDGKPDLMVTDLFANPDDESGLVGVLLGNGDGTFQPVLTYGSGGDYAYSVVVGDVNGDGKPDLAVANACVNNSCPGNGTVDVLLGNGDGTFQAAVSYDSGGCNPDSVAGADVNGDGKLDLVVENMYTGSGCTTNGNVGVLLGNGDGTFQPVLTYGSGGDNPISIAVGDVNGDGKPDLLVANFCANGCNGADGIVGVLLGNGDGTFQAAVSYDSGGYDAWSVAVADVNGDGKPDLAVANCGGWCGSPGSNGSVGVLMNSSLTPTTTALTSSLNPSNFGQAVTFTATATALPGFDKSVPTGTVSFYDGTTNIGNSNLNSGVATLTTSTLAVGTHSMTATYNGDTNFVPSTSPTLNQVVQGAIASLSPGSLNFGNQTAGITSSPQNVTLTNNGNINLTISLIQISGTNSGDFNQTNNCPSSLTPNNSCQIGVTFTPTTTGTRNAAVSVTDNAPGSPQSVSLTGVGVVPAVTFSPTNLTFPTQLVFTTGPAQQLTLTNSGAGVLKISHIAVASPFQQTNNCPSSLGSGASCTISVKFRPANKGGFHGAVSVTDNAPGSPQKVPLMGTGTFVQLLPTKLNFGTQPVGTRSLPKKITLTNKGDGPVNITSIAITGTDAVDFAETNNCGKSVASGASCFIKVTFEPLAKGKRTAHVSLYDNGGGSPQRVGLTGTGT